MASFARNHQKEHTIKLTGADEGDFEGACLKTDLIDLFVKYIGLSHRSLEPYLGYNSKAERGKFYFPKAPC